MRTRIILTLVSFALLSCSGDDDLPNTNLIGTWDWISSSGGIAGTTETPESTGESRSLIISSNTIKNYLNETLISEYEYVIEIRESVIFNELREMIVLENGFREIINRDGNNLTLIGDCNDCFAAGYIRR